MRSPGGGGGSDDPGRGGRQVPAEESGAAASRTRERRRRTREGTAGRGRTSQTYERILVPLDGTPFAEAALTPAAALATRAGAVLDLVSVMARGDSSTDLGGAVEAAEPGSLEFADRLEEYVLRAMERVETQWGCEVTSGVLPEGEPGTALRSYVDRTGADLTVAAAHADGVPAEALLGHLSRDLLSEAPCALLLIPAEETGPPDGNGPLHGPVRSVAAVLEGTPEKDREVIRHAVRMARLWRAPLRVLEVDRGEGGAEPRGAGPQPPGEGAQPRSDVARWVEEAGGRDVDLEMERSAEAAGPDPVVAFLDRHQAGLVCVTGAGDRALGPLFGARGAEATAEPVRRAGVLVCACA